MEHPSNTKMGFKIQVGVSERGIQVKIKSRIEITFFPSPAVLVKQLSPLRNSMEIETRTENKNKEQRKNKLGSMFFIKCVPKAKKNKRKFTLFHPQMGPKNKTSFVQKRATNNLQLFTIRKHTQNSSVFPLTNKTTKSTKPTMTTQHPLQVHLLAIHDTQ